MIRLKKTALFASIFVFLNALTSVSWALYGDLEKIGIDQISTAFSLPDDDRFKEQIFSLKNYQQIPECWNSPIIYNQNFSNLTEDSLLTFTRKHYFKDLNLLFLKVGQTGYCKTTITNTSKGYFTLKEANQIADIITRANGFNLKYKITDNKNEIVYRGEKLEVIDGEWLEEIALKKDSQGNIRMIIFYLSDI